MTDGPASLEMVTAEPNGLSQINIPGIHQPGGKSLSLTEAVGRFAGNSSMNELFSSALNFYCVTVVVVVVVAVREFD